MALYALKRITVYYEKLILKAVCQGTVNRDVLYYYILSVSSSLQLLLFLFLYCIRPKRFCELQSIICTEAPLCIPIFPLFLYSVMSYVFFYVYAFRILCYCCCFFFFLYLNAIVNEWILAVNKLMAHLLLVLPDGLSIISNRPIHWFALDVRI